MVTYDPRGFGKTSREDTGEDAMPPLMARFWHGYVANHAPPLARSGPAVSSFGAPAPLHHWTDCCPSIRRREGAQEQALRVH